MDSFHHPKMRSTFEKLMRSTVDGQTMNSTHIIQALGQFVCGHHSFLQIQSERPSDLLSRFLITGVKDYHSEKAYNEYGPNGKRLWEYFMYDCKQIFGLYNGITLGSLSWLASINIGLYTITLIKLI